jgi:thiamine biosynthesis lipoprotein
MATFVRLRAFIAAARHACFAFALFGFALLCAACRSAAPERAEFTRIAMGVRTTITIYASDSGAANAAANAAFLRIAELDQALSDWLVDSETQRVCELAGTGGLPVSEDLAFALETSLGLAAASEGLFDPTVGPLVRQWRAMRASGRLASDAERAAARELVGFRLVELDRSKRTVQLAKRGMRLDFGGIGKGLAAQAALDRLRERGLPCALVALAGDVAVGAPPPGKRGWSVALPSVQTASGSARVLELANAAVSTSGDAEQFVIVDGRRYAHIVDPRTGLGAESPRTATVVAPRGELADALATALALADDALAETLVARFPDTAAVLVDAAGERRELDPAHVLAWRE